MTSRVSGKNKEKKAKRKNNVKKKNRPNRKTKNKKQTTTTTKQQQKNGTKKQKTASPGVESGLSARASRRSTHSKVGDQHTRKAMEARLITKRINEI